MAMTDRVLDAKDQILRSVDVFFQTQDESFMATLLKRHVKPGQDKLCSKDELASALGSINVKVNLEEVEVAFFTADNGDGVGVKELMQAAHWPSKAEEWVSNLPLSGLLIRCLSFHDGDSGLEDLASLNYHEVSTAVDLFAGGLKRLLQEKLEQLRTCFRAKAQTQTSGSSAKFQTFKMSSGKVEDFHAGLGGRVGAPNPDLEKGLKTEHCDKVGCKVPFETTNYGIVTTPLEEFQIAMGDVECPEAQLKDKMGKVVRIVQKKDVLMKKDVVTAAMLLWLEVLSVVLYTGPMFQVYNTILRRFPVNVFEGFKDNLYATTIHVLVSAVTKIARSVRMPTGLVVYRGLGGLAELPEGFYKTDQRGCRGFMEWAMLSTTSDKHAALEYSGIREGRPVPTLLKITTTSVDRPACIMDLSQYPGEREYLFAPGAFLEPVRDLRSMELVENKDGRPEGVVEIVSARINANLKVQTVEELKGRKKVLHMDAFRYGLEEALRDFDRLAEACNVEARRATDVTRDQCSWEDFRESVLQKAEVVLKRHEKVSPEDYSIDEVHRGLVTEMLKTKESIIAAQKHYLEDRSLYLSVLKHRRFFDYLRFYHAFLWRTLPAGVGEARRDQANRLARGLGLLRDSIDEKDGEGLTPLLKAAADGVGFRGLACLVWAGIDVNKKGDGEVTAVWLASELGNDQVVRDLSSFGADVDYPDFVAKTPMFAAARNGHADAIKALCSAGANINQPDREGWTPLYIAASNCHVDAIKALCSAGANLNQPDNDGRTPLYTAVIKGHADAVKALCSAGADVNQPEKTGLTPLGIAKQRGRSDVVDILLGFGAR